MPRERQRSQLHARLELFRKEEGVGGEVVDVEDQFVLEDVKVQDQVVQLGVLEVCVVVRDRRDRGPEAAETAIQPGRNSLRMEGIERGREVFYGHRTLQSGVKANHARA